MHYLNATLGSSAWDRTLRIKQLRRISCVLFAAFFAAYGVLNAGYFGSRIASALASTTLSIERPGQEAVALDHPDMFAMSNDKIKNSHITYFKQQADAMAVREAKQSFTVPANTPGSQQMQEVLGQAHAEFAGAFQHRSGIKVNLYQSTLGSQLRLKLNSQAVATAMQFVIDYAPEMNDGYMTKEQVSRLQTLAGTGKLDYVTINIVMSASPDVCNDQLIPGDILKAMHGQHLLQDSQRCSTSGTYFPLNLTSGSQQVVQTLSLSLFNGNDTYDNSSLAEHLAVQQRGMVTLAHEYAHAFADLSGVRAQRLAGGSTQTALDQTEHTAFVGRLEASIRALSDDKVSTHAIDRSGNGLRVSVLRIPFRTPPITLAKR